MTLAVGVLPYPLTFLCTDLISELYGRRRANFLVLVGFVLNFFILGCLWLGNSLPAAEAQPPWQVLELARSSGLAQRRRDLRRRGTLRTHLRMHVRGGLRVHAGLHRRAILRRAGVPLPETPDARETPLGAQLFLDPDQPARGLGDRHLRDVRGGVSAGDFTVATILVLIGSNYAFKVMVALADTAPFYAGTYYLKRYLGVDNLSTY